MNWLAALILGLIQGLTEFLPVSSSGHLELGEVLLGTKLEENLTFTVAVHGATVLSTIVVFYRDILSLTRSFITFRHDDQTRTVIKLLFSMIPVIIAGLFLSDRIESLFTGNVLFVGVMLLVTALLLVLAHVHKPGKRSISYLDALIIGIAQAVAVLPGLSRSGATISTGLLLGDKREEVTRFSFLMVLIPVIGANLMEVWQHRGMPTGTIGILPLAVGFVAAFISGLLACRWMIRIVKKGKLIYFAIYCLIIGLMAVIISL
jgi:undecaprenyl-diphosphatase